MKIFISCKDILIEKSLVLFLKEYMCSKKECEFIVCDEKINYNKPQFIVNHDAGHLKLPFSKKELIDALYEFHSTILQEDNHVLTFEEKLENLLEKFKYDLIKLVNEK